MQTIEQAENVTIQTLSTKTLKIQKKLHTKIT